MFELNEIYIIFKESYNKNKLIYFFFIIGFILSLLVFFLRNYLGIFLYFYLIFGFSLMIPLIINEKIYAAILLLFLLFSSITSVLGRLIKPTLLLISLLIFIDFINNKWKGFHWSKIHFYILLYIITIACSILFTVDYDRLKMDLYDLIKAIGYFILLSEIAILLIKEYSIKVISIFFLSIIIASAVG